MLWKRLCQSFTTNTLAVAADDCHDFGVVYQPPTGAAPNAPVSRSIVLLSSNASAVVVLNLPFNTSVSPYIAPALPWQECLPFACSARYCNCRLLRNQRPARW